MSGKVDSLKQVNNTSWVAVVTPTDRPKSVRNCCVIELFCGVVCVVTLPFWHFCWCRGFCHRTESDLFLFLFRRKLCITEGEQLRIRKKWNLYIFVQQNALIDIKISIIDICYRNMAPIPKPMMFMMCPFDIFCWCRSFDIWLSQIPFFFSDLKWCIHLSTSLFYIYYTNQ